jgi:hypothetical protein
LIIRMMNIPREVKELLRREAYERALTWSCYLLISWLRT